MGQSWGRKHHESGSGKTQGSLKAEYGVDNEYSGETFPPIEVPDEILYEVLKWVPTEDIVKSCVYVCKQWRNVINIQMFWKEKCIPKHGYTNEIFRFLMDEDFKKLYFKRPYQNNLIKNPDAREEFSHWKIHDNGGDRWRVETPPIEDYTGNKLTKGTLCWVTSYATCSKSQTIDLLERGCSEHVLDDVKPKIHVSEWYAARPDCGIEYRITVQLLRNKEDEIAVKEWTFEDTKPAGRHWFKAEHTFSNYEPGVRFIRYYHEGKDIKFWTGWYGAKMTLSSVILDLKHTSCEASSERSSKTS
ncbi:F-box only protein 6-like [Mercenaria mercenaria]|uniref:F-box only protein 6-like n=1 Tax=Mercenaria mercenaria TaxID=6596 RepID=UPI00234EE44C|nr:F-box only protein 6-like [Mercenaria mercenaria]